MHLNVGGLPLNRYLVEIRVPDAVWQAAMRVTADRLPIGWDAEPASLTTIRLVPDEFNALLNPLHADASKLTVRMVRKWLFDPRFSKA